VSRWPDWDQPAGTGRDRGEPGLGFRRPAQYGTDQVSLEPATLFVRLAANDWLPADFREVNVVAKI
jgi:hypothetical protein